MTPRGWLSTWSGLSSAASMAANMGQVTIPTLILHPTADTEIRRPDAISIRDASGADDLVHDELIGAAHYLEGHRVDAADRIVEWLDPRLP